MNTINTQRNGVEYSEIYKNLQKEVAEQNAKTAQLPSKGALVDYLEKQSNGDKAEFNNYVRQNENVGVENMRQN